MGLCLIDFRLDSVETHFICITKTKTKKRFDDVFVIVVVPVRNLPIVVVGKNAHM
jgi:hypothetical protein